MNENRKTASPKFRVLERIYGKCLKQRRSMLELMFVELRNVDWKKQYDIYRPEVTRQTSDDELCDIFCQMLAPLHDGHVELIAKAIGDRKKRYFNPEKKPRFWKEFANREIQQLLKTTEKTLVANGFGRPTETQACLLHYCSHGHLVTSGSSSWKA